MGVVTGKGLADLIREQLRRPDHLLRHGGAADRQPRPTPSPSSPAWPPAWRSSASRKYVSVPLGRAVRLVAGRQGHLPARREGLPGRVPVLRRLPHLRLPGAARLGRGALRGRSRPTFQCDGDYVVMLIGLVGHDHRALDAVLPAVRRGREGRRRRRTTATPRIDVIVGCIVTDVVAFFIIVACAATLHEHGITIETAARTPRWRWRRWPASTAPGSSPSACSTPRSSPPSILPLSTAYYVCEGFGWEIGHRQEVRRGAAVLLALHRRSSCSGAACHPDPALPARSGSCCSRRS